MYIIGAGEVWYITLIEFIAYHLANNIFSRWIIDIQYKKFYIISVVP